MGEGDVIDAQVLAETKASKDESVEPVTVNKENGAEDKETTKDKSVEPLTVNKENGAEDKETTKDVSVELVTGNKENGAEDDETTKDPNDVVAGEENAAVEEVLLGEHPANGEDIIEEKLNENMNKENIGDSIEEKQPEEQLNEEGKDADTAKENDEAHETVQKELEKENQNDLERQDDVEGKQDDVVDTKEMSAEVQEVEKNSAEENGLEKAEQEMSDSKKENKKSKDVQEPKTPAVSTFSIDRPVRERKSVERLVAVIERDSSKDFYIEKGGGVALKDIPNVAYKLSKRKSDDTLKLLHSILFSRRGKAAEIKNNISKFSGFVWHGNEEKQKLKIKEKLEKCFKEKLFEFCDILDITISKATIKKNDVVSMLLEFLVSPHATTDDILAEKDESNKGIKRKRSDKATPGSASAKNRKRRTESDNTDEKTNSADTEDESAEDTKEKEDDVQDEALTVPETKVPTDEVSKKSMSEEKLSGPEDQTDEVTTKRKRKRTPKMEEADFAKPSKKTSSSKKTTSGSKNETPEVKTKKTSSLKKNDPSPKATPRNSKQSKVDADKVTSPKVSSRKQKEEVKPVKEKTATASKEKVGKRAAKGKEKSGDKKLELTDETIREETCKILREVDFNTATFTDILKILTERFKTDLTPRKPDIRTMVQEELAKLAEEEDDEEEVAEEGEEKSAHTDEAHTSLGQKV